MFNRLVGVFGEGQGWDGYSSPRTLWDSCSSPPLSPTGHYSFFYPPPPPPPNRCNIVGMPKSPAGCHGAKHPICSRLPLSHLGNSVGTESTNGSLRLCVMSGSILHTNQPGLSSCYMLHYMLRLSAAYKHSTSDTYYLCFASCIDIFNIIFS